MHGWYDTCFLVVCPEPAGPWVGCEPPHSGSPHPPVGDLLESDDISEPTNFAAIQNAPKPSYIGWPDTAALHRPPWEPPVPWLSGTCQLYLDQHDKSGCLISQVTWIWDGLHSGHGPSASRRAAWRRSAAAAPWGTSLAPSGALV